MVDSAWISLIAGSYAALTITMLLTSGVYFRKVMQHGKSIDLATLALFLGITISFGGHFFDQLLWTASNVQRALGTGAALRLSAWYAENIPWIVVAGKFLASAGAFFHLWVTSRRTTSLPRTLAHYTLAWMLVALTVAWLVH